MNTPLGSGDYFDPDDRDAIATGGMWSGGRLTHAAVRLVAAFVTLARLNQELKQQGRAGVGAGAGAPVGAESRTQASGAGSAAR
jgi:hypothetical protein